MTGPDHPSYSPQVAFGLRAGTVAFKAKTGQLRRGEADDLAPALHDLIPDDTAAHLAVVQFTLRIADDPVGAADALLGFLAGWHADLPLAATEAALRDQAPHGWQTRKDTGLE